LDAGAEKVILKTVKLKNRPRRKKKKKGSRGCRCPDERAKNRQGAIAVSWSGGRTRGALYSKEGGFDRHRAQKQRGARSGAAKKRAKQEKGPWMGTDCKDGCRTIGVGKRLG